ncbi:hypothetical protein HZB01_01800 [Candidatus Woesearchaeota archaeon]|nr:hypothetical protein [Candidatus Woesearchaeota archaeon]
MASAATLEQKLDTRIGILAELVPQFAEGSWRTSAEIMNERWTDKKLRDQVFYVNNAAVYEMEDGEAMLSFGRADPFFKNIDELTKQLLKKNNYVPTPDELAAFKPAALKIKVSELKLLGGNDEWGYFEIQTGEKDYGLNTTQRAFAEAIYGTGKDFERNMEWLSTEEKVSTVKVYALQEAYVQMHAKNNAIARGCWLGDTYLNSGFGAVGHDVNGHVGLRGVLLNPAEGGATSGIDYHTLAAPFNTPSPGFNPAQLAKALTPKGAELFKEVLSAYVPPGK